MSYIGFTPRIRHAEYFFNKAPHCRQCQGIERESGGAKAPMCMTAKGCWVGDIAPDRRLNAKYEAFVRMESLDTFGGGYAEMQQRYLRESGLIDETPET